MYTFTYFMEIKYYNLKGVRNELFLGEANKNFPFSYYQNLEIFPFYKPLNLGEAFKASKVHRFHNPCPWHYQSPIQRSITSFIVVFSPTLALYFWCDNLENDEL